jgi:hypothetical protein
MKNILFLIILQLSCFGIINAQDVTKKSYEIAIDYLNCKSVELSLEGDTENLKIFQSNCNCDNKDSYDYSKITKSINNENNKTLELSKEIDNLKKEDNSKKRIPDLLIYLTKDIFSTKEKLIKFKEKHKDKFVSYINDLKNKLKDLLKDNSRETNTEVINNQAYNSNSNIIQDIEIRIQKLEERQENIGFLGTMGDYLILICLILLLTIFYSKSYNKIIQGVSKSKRIKELITDSIENNLKSAATNFTNPTRNEVSKDEIRDINTRIRDLEASIQNLSSKLSAVNQPPNIGQSGTGITSNSGGDIIIKDTEQNFFYLSTPNTDGSFNESSASPNFKEGASIYRFTKLNANKAIFQIDDRESSIRLALQFPDKSIDPVCDATNAFNPKAIKIKTDQPGEVELQNGKWRVTKKSKIRYDG